jgi:hypothetical protein
MNGRIPNRKSYAAYVDDRPEDRVFRVDRTVYNDPEILEAEYRNIFEANWVFLCHQAHVPKPGDYFATHIGPGSTATAASCSAAWQPMCLICAITSARRPR